VGILIDTWFVLPVVRFSRFTDDFLVTEGSDQSFLDCIYIGGTMLVPWSQSMFMKTLDFFKFLGVLLECVY